MLTTCFGHSGPSSGRKNIYKDVSILNRIQRQLCFYVPTPFLIAKKKHNGDDALKDPIWNFFHAVFVTDTNFIQCLKQKWLGKI